MDKTASEAMAALLAVIDNMQYQRKRNDAEGFAKAFRAAVQVKEEICAHYGIALEIVPEGVETALSIADIDAAGTVH